MSCLTRTLATSALSFASLLRELILELFIVRGYHASVGIRGYWYQQESVDVSIKGYECQWVYVVWYQAVLVLVGI